VAFDVCQLHIWKHSEQFLYLTNRSHSAIITSNSTSMSAVSRSPSRTLVRPNNFSSILWLSVPIVPFQLSALNVNSPNLRRNRRIDNIPLHSARYESIRHPRDGPMPAAARPDSLLIIHPNAPSVPNFSDPSLPARNAVWRTSQIVNASAKRVEWRRRSYSQASRVDKYSSNVPAALCRVSTIGESLVM
jgi:hypothetical protein